MSRNSFTPYNTGIMARQRRQTDKYAGMFSSKQMRDLEGETELPVYKQTRADKERAEKIRKMGCGSGFMDSYNPR